MLWFFACGIAGLRVRLGPLLGFLTLLLIEMETLESIPCLSLFISCFLSNFPCVGFSRTGRER